MTNRLRLLALVTPLLALALCSSWMRAADEKRPPSTTKRPRPYCENWPKPDFALFITGRQHGYIEPCGCTGLDNQKGGLARRRTMYQALVGRGWDVVPIDVGNQIRRFGQQAAIKFQTTMAALRKMKYQAVGLGPDDLRLDVGELLSEIVDDTPLVCANVSVVGYPVSDGHKIVEVGNHRIGITSVLGEKEMRGIKNDDLELRDPLKSIHAAHDKFVAKNCDLMILLCHATSEETLKLATADEKTKAFRIVVTAGGADEPALQPERIPNTKSYLVQTGKKGMYVGVLGIYANDKERPLRYERVPLDSRFKDSKEGLQALAVYQNQLKELYTQGWQYLGISPVAHHNGNFVGSAACQECHEAAYEKWKTTPHHKATKSIAFPGERSSIVRHYDPECLSCHVTGWNPQAYVPYKTGYESFEKSKLLHGNGCENCHGPGADHVAAERGDVDADEDRLLALQEQMRLPLDRAEENCLQCHDLDNDPHFQEDGAFDKYWAQIEHYE